MSVFGKDITERKQAEAEVLRQRSELAHVARVSTMGELAASVAHELNQPLGAILANAEAAELFLQQDTARAGRTGAPSSPISARTTSARAKSSAA